MAATGHDLMAADSRRIHQIREHHRHIHDLAHAHSLFHRPDRNIMPHVAPQVSDVAVAALPSRHVLSR